MRRYMIASWILVILSVFHFTLGAPLPIPEIQKVCSDEVNVAQDEKSVWEKRMDAGSGSNDPIDSESGSNYPTDSDSAHEGDGRGEEHAGYSTDEGHNGYGADSDKESTNEEHKTDPYDADDDENDDGNDGDGGEHEYDYMVDYSSADSDAHTDSDARHDSESLHDYSSSGEHHSDSDDPHDSEAAGTPEASPEHPPVSGFESEKYLAKLLKGALLRPRTSGSGAVDAPEWE